MKSQVSQSSDFFLLLIYLIALVKDKLQILIGIIKKLDSHSFDAITQLRNKRQPNESKIVTLLSEETKGTKY